jgi:hypothetical protein
MEIGKWRVEETEAGREADAERGERREERGRASHEDNMSTKYTSMNL